MKTRVQPLRNTRFYYPDVQVTCAASDSDKYFKSQPKLIIEVLSPSTERRDRAEKFYAYKTLDSLEEYVLVAQDEPRLEIYRRRTGWELEIYGSNEEYLGMNCHLASVDMHINVTEVYEQVVLEPSASQLDSERQ